VAAAGAGEVVAAAEAGVAVGVEEVEVAAVDGATTLPRGE
jgi:hypothetical protein